MELAVIPTTLAELAPPKMRGAIGVLYWLAIKLGGLTVTGITRGTSTIPSNASWRIPFGIILVVPSLVAGLIWLTPESPRWLLMKDRNEDAGLSLARLHGRNIPGDDIVAIREQLSQQVALQMRMRNFSDVFAPQNRMRTFVVVTMNFLQVGQILSSLLCRHADLVSSKLADRPSPPNTAPSSSKLSRRSTRSALPSGPMLQTSEP